MQLLIQHMDCPNRLPGESLPLLYRNESWDELGLKEDLEAFSCTACGQVIVVKEVEEE